MIIIMITNGLKIKCLQEKNMDIFISLTIKLVPRYKFKFHIFKSDEDIFVPGSIF